MHSLKESLHEALARVLAARGYQTLTPVQRAVLTAAPAAADLLVLSRTGSGKTLAYGLVVADALLAGPVAPAIAVAGAPRALILTPTRELAAQVHGEVSWLLSGTPLGVVLSAGGRDMRAEIARFGAPSDVVVASPGRLRDHALRGTLDLAAIEWVVLDEADELLRLGFREDVEFLLERTAGRRRTLMFSATMTPELERISAAHQPARLRIDLTQDQRPQGTVLHEAMFVARRDRENALINVLRYYHPRSALVFCGRRDRAAALCLWLQGRGFAATQLSGALDQAARNAAVAALRTGRVSVCVATDLAARGLDVPLLELVVHADVPGSVETLVHRSGRTGRAGRSGRAVFLVSGSERGRLAELMRRAGRPVLWRPVPRPADVFSRDLVRIVGDPVFQEAATERDLALADALMRVYGPDRIAVACGRLWFSAQPEAQPITETARLHTGTAGPSYRFAIETEIAAGQGMRPLLREIARQSGVLRTEIGRVRRGRHRIEFEVCGAPAVRLARRIGSGEMPGVRLVSEPERPTAPD